ncbi:MAG: hypothetical protein QOH35_2079, partial [Acidobacteriaceae bacterium]|nr:hypothetical protein [Acidobacteriaceae bacterium]
RANSRDSEALTLNESAEGQRIYWLHLESRELRNQARRLKQQRADSMTSEPGNPYDRNSWGHHAAAVSVSDPPCS